MVWAPLKKKFNTLLTQKKFKELFNKICTINTTPWTDLSVGYQRFAKYAFIHYLKENETEFETYAKIATDNEDWRFDVEFTELFAIVVALKKKLNMKDRNIQDQLDYRIQLYKKSFKRWKTQINDQQNKELDELHVHRFHTGFQLQKVW